MGLDKFSESILDEAKKEADRIEDEGKDQARKILTDAKEHIRAIEKESSDRVDAEISALERKEIASAKLESKRPIMDARKDLIEDTYSKVEENLASLDGKMRRSMIEKLLDEALSEIRNSKRVYANCKDLEIIKKRAPDMELIEKDMLGGMIVESNDGKVRVDKSFSTILDNTKKKTLRDVVDILFK